MSNKGTHLTIEGRLILAKALSEGKLLKEIALSIQKDERTIAKEIVRNREIKPNNHAKNKCGKRDICNVSRLCINCHNKCSACKLRDCNELCSDFSVAPSCQTLNRFPRVCNGCTTLSTCKKNKYIYNPISAHEKYETTLVSSRQHVYYSDLEP